MKIILFDTPDSLEDFFPLTYTRSIADLRCGIFTIKERWEKLLQTQVYIQTTELLTPLYEVPPAEDENILLISSSVFPTQELVAEILKLEPGEELYTDTHLIAQKKAPGIDQIKSSDLYAKVFYQPMDLIFYNNQVIEDDWKWINTSHEKVLEASIASSPENIKIEDSAKVTGAILNADEGPIYIGENVVIQEGAVVRGPVVILENTTIMSQAHIRHGVTIGPHCMIGGEIKQSIILGYSNKAHEGYLGDSYIGQFVNLGAGTTTSNLKNNYHNIDLWNDRQLAFLDSGRIKAGSLIGDYVHTAIGTLFNSGTYVGIGSNIFGGGLQTKYIAPFTWGITENYEESLFFDFVKKVTSLKQVTLSSEYLNMLKTLFKLLNG